MTTEVRLYQTDDPTGDPETTVKAGEVKKVVFGEDFWTGRLIGRDPSGKIVYDRQLSWQELNRLDRVVIE